MHLIDHFALRPELTIEHNYCEAKTKSNNKRVELKRDAIPKMTATNSSDMSTEVNTIASCADIVVQNQVLSTSTDQGNKTDGQRKPNKTIHGTALDQNNGNALAADIDLVVYGVARNITSIQVSKWIEDQGIKVFDCVLLTKYEQARTLSFKITISASNYEKSQDPSMWPYRVHVHPYRNYNRKRQDYDTNKRSKNGPNLDEKYEKYIMHEKPYICQSKHERKWKSV